MFNIMKKTTLSTLAAIALVGAVSAPVMAQSSFNQRVPAVRQDNNNDQLVGGAIGAVLGGVIGSEVAGRGNRTEGAVVGALLGGVTGAAIADNGNNRRFNNRGFSSRRGFNSGFGSRNSYGYYDYGYARSSRFSSRRFGNSRSFGSRRSFGRSSSFRRGY